jgi:hypothetical protein
MFINEVTLNIYLLALVIGLSVWVGFAIRSKKVLQCRTKIEELEREILNNYAHILELERESLNMELQAQDTKSPVITMKAPSREIMETASKKNPDISLRKQLLSKKNIEQQSASGL